MDSARAPRIGHHEEQRTARPWHLATGSIACPGCDAPLLLGTSPAHPHDPMTCPVCDHAAAVRDFLSLAPPLRAPRVHVLVRMPRLDRAAQSA